MQIGPGQQLLTMQVLVLDAHRVPLMHLSNREHSSFAAHKYLFVDVRNL